MMIMISCAAQRGAGKGENADSQICAIISTQIHVILYHNSARLSRETYKIFRHRHVYLDRCGRSSAGVMPRCFLKIFEKWMGSV